MLTLGVYPCLHPNLQHYQALERCWGDPCVTPGPTHGARRLTDDVQDAVLGESVLVVAPQVPAKVVLAAQLGAEVAEQEGAVPQAQVPQQAAAALKALVDNLGSGLEDHRGVILGVRAIEVPDPMHHRRPQFIREVKTAGNGHTCPLEGRDGRGHPGTPVSPSRGCG